jgi:hypothetical protein
VAYGLGAALSRTSCNKRTLRRTFKGVVPPRGPATTGGNLHEHSDTDATGMEHPRPGRPLPA